MTPPYSNQTTSPERQQTGFTVEFCVFIALVIAGLTFVNPGELSAQSPSEKIIEVKNLWPEDITLKSIPPTMQLNPAYVPLWMEALKSNETDLKQEIVATLERVHRLGFDQSGVADTMRDMISDDNHHTLNMALASFLIAIDDQESAEILFGLLEPGRVELAQVVEPALAKWDYQPIREIWGQRLSQKHVRRTLLLLAIDGLNTVKHEPSGTDLAQIALDRTQETAVRISAARAAGSIHDDGLVESASALIGSDSGKSLTSMVDSLCAVAMLSRHQTDASNVLLQQLLVDDQSAVAAAAWKRLLEIDSALAVAFAGQCRTNPDPSVRGHVVTALREQPNLERIDWLGQFMDDRHPGIRVQARISLIKLATESAEFDKRIRAQGMQMLQNKSVSHRGLEQTFTLLANLDHKPAAQMAVDFLRHDHADVRIAAAWSLRVLLEQNTYPKMLERANEISETVMGKIDDDNWHLAASNLDELAHLFDAFGEFGYPDSEKLLRRYVPKNHDLGTNSRPAAITALGKLLAGDAKSDLIPALVRRMHDQVSETAESSELCATCAIALGRMNAKSALSDIRRYYDGEPPVSGMHYSAAWAIREITGKKFPDPASPIVKLTGFTLEPEGKRLRPQDKDAVLDEE